MIASFLCHCNPESWVGLQLLAPGDIILYDAPMWLNDKCINFWLEYSANVSPFLLPAPAAPSPPLFANSPCENVLTLQRWYRHVHYDLLKNNQDIVFMSPCALAVTIHLKPEMVADSVFLLKLPQRQLHLLAEARTGLCWSTHASKMSSGIVVQQVQLSVSGNDLLEPRSA
eukprot:1695099-Rhodomonas_salina.1